MNPRHRCSDEDARTCLQQAGLRVTRQRLRILRLLEEAEQPVSAEEIPRRLEGEGDPSARMPLATVYRVLDTLVRASLCDRTGPGTEGEALYVAKGRHHGHRIACLACGRSVPVPSCGLSCLEEDVARETGYRVSGHRMEWFGLCPDCRKRPESDDPPT